jgi:hypothetical protein
MVPQPNPQAKKKTERKRKIENEKWRRAQKRML